MGAVMHKQVPGIGDQSARKESAAGDQIDQRKTTPYLPEDGEDRLVRVGMMKAVSGWHETMQHKAVNAIFGKGPRNNADDKKHGVESHSELRNR